MSMKLHRYIQSVQSQTFGDVLIFGKELDKQVQTLVETSIALTFEYRMKPQDRQYKTNNF